MESAFFLEVSDDSRLAHNTFVCLRRWEQTPMHLTFESVEEDFLRAPVQEAKAMSLPSWLPNESCPSGEGVGDVELCLQR